MIDPAVRFGKPVVKGTRVPVDVVIRELAGGMGISELCREYDLAEIQVRAVLQYAADRVSNETFAVV